MDASYPKPARASTIAGLRPTIRRARADDAKALAAIGAATFSETFGHLYPPEDLAAFLAEAHSVVRARDDLANPAKAAWIVEADGAVVGYALACPAKLPHPDVAAGDRELDRFYLLESHQSGGLGSRLFAEIMAWLQDGGPRGLWIGVWSENHGARRFYARHGFEVVGTYEFVVGRTRDHELIMRRG